LKLGLKKPRTAANLGLALHPSEGEKVNNSVKDYVEKSKEQKEISLTAIA
jgi:hypothetical protein